MLRLILILLSIFFFPNVGLSQLVANEANQNDTLWAVSGSTCKNPIQIVFGDRVTQPNVSIAAAMKKPNKTVASFSGSATYELLRRDNSSLDRFSNDFSSDVLKVSGSLLFNNVLPFTVGFQYTKTSPYQITEKFEVSFSYDREFHSTLLKERILDKAKRSLNSAKDSLTRLTDNDFLAYRKKVEELKSPSFQERITNQNMMANTRFSYNQQIPVVQPSYNSPAVLANPRIKAPKVGQRQSQPAVDEYEAKKRVADSLYGVYQNASVRLGKYQSVVNKAIDSIRQVIDNIEDISKLEKLSRDKGIMDSSRKSSILNFLKQTGFGIGSFAFHQSDLTVSGVVLKGLRINVGNGTKILVAGGKYLHHYRPFLMHKDSSNQEAPKVLALKVGKWDNRNVKAINFFIGQRWGNQLSSYSPVSGISIERKMQISKSSSVSFELAKSAGRKFNSDKSELYQLFTKLDFRSVSAYTSLDAYLLKTKTSVFGSYTFSGESFQSLNLSSFSLPKNKLEFKIGQGFLNSRIQVTTGIKYNEWKHTGIMTTATNKTYFGHASASMRLKKLPVFLLSYNPGSQIYLEDNKSLYQFIYYNLHVSLQQQLRIKGQAVLVNVFYNELTNKFSDSIFYDKHQSVNVHLSSWMDRCAVNLSYSGNLISDLYTHITDASFITNGTRVNFGAGLKFNNSSSSFRLGYGMQLRINKIMHGALNVRFDRSFIPDRRGVFIPYDFGTIQFIKPIKFKI